jgi:sugar transferase (PEP-CTERM/EpsH1 system associated)
VRILYICHRFPYPPKRGGKIRPFNMIRHLHASHEVTVASLARSRAEAEEGSGIADFCARHEVVIVADAIQAARMVARLPTPVPSSFGYFHSNTLARRIRQMIRTRPFDLIFVHCSSVARYVEHMSHVPKILDFGDMDSHKWLDYARFKPFPLSVGYQVEGVKLVAEEKRLARAFDICTTTTRAEWSTLDGYGTGAATDWFPNGVDSTFFTPAPDGAYDPDTISFVGRMDYYPNQECMLAFCRGAFSRIRERRPNAKLLVVGAEPSPAIRRLAEIHGVEVTGSVPDVRPYLHRSAVMVAPLNIARGTQNKILEAMAAGVPVVTSSTAAGGVDAVAGTHLLVADTESDVAAAALTLMSDPAARRRLAHAARARMLSHHAWSSSMRRLDGILDRCIQAWNSRHPLRGLVPQQPSAQPRQQTRAGAETAPLVEAGKHE